MFDLPSTNQGSFVIHLAERALLSRFLKFYGQNIGVLTDVNKAALEWIDFACPGLEYFRVTATNQNRLGGSFPASGVGFGQSDRQSTALIRALGEGIERVYSGFLPQDPDIVWATHAELSRQNLVLPLEDYQVVRQFQESDTVRRFRSDVPLNWLRVEAFKESDERCYFPLALCSLHYDHMDGYDFSTTNGVGLGASLEQASVSGLMELIERDALMRLWWLRQVPRRLRPEDIIGCLSFPTRQFLLHVQKHIRIFDLTDVWSVPVAATYLEGYGPNQPLVHLGTSSGFSFDEAIEKCMQETMRVWRINSFKRKYSLSPKYIEPPYEKSVQSFNEIEALTFQREAYQACQFLKSASIPVGAPSEIRSPSDWSGLGEHIVSRGARLYRINHTADFLAERGLFVTRIRSPEMISLNCTHAFRPWGCLALADKDLSVLNPFPQLFL